MTTLAQHLVRISMEGPAGPRKARALCAQYGWYDAVVFLDYIKVQLVLRHEDRHGTERMGNYRVVIRPTFDGWFSKCTLLSYTGTRALAREHRELAEEMVLTTLKGVYREVP